MAKRPEAISRYLQHSDQLSSLQKTCREEAKLLQEIQQQFAHEIAGHFTALHLDGQVLTLYVDTHAWASKLRYLSEMIAAKAAVKEVRIRVSPPPSMRKQQRDESRHPRHSDKASELLSKAASHTSDEDLKAVLQRLSDAVKPRL